MNGYLIFDNRLSTEVGLRISGFSTFDAPKRIYDTVTVPGRNGALHIDCGAFENVPMRYEASLVHDFSKNSAALREWLLSPIGYRRLEDSYHPDTFRLARYSGGISFTNFTQLCRAAKVELQFDCKPQRFLKIGEVLIENPTTIHNPTAFPSKPSIQFWMSSESGTVVIGDSVITINGASAGDSIMIDGETMDAINSVGENRNSLISISNDLILSGNAETAITSTGIAKLTITPRWWTV